MSDRFIDSGVLVVYEGGDQLFHGKEHALKFAEFMEGMGRMCEFYHATIEGGKITRRRWIDPETLSAEVRRSQSKAGAI